MKKTSIFALLALSTAVVACDAAPKDGAGSGEKGAEKPAADASGKPKAGAKAGGDEGGDVALESETKTFEKIGLTAELPAMSTVSDPIGGGEGVMIVGAAPVNIMVAKADDPKTVDDAKKAAEMFKPENFKDEKLDDGWLVTYENKGSMGTNYWLEARREIDGKAYRCHTSVMKDAQRKSAIDICKSLKKK